MKRPAAVAGLFYPAEESALRAQIEGFLAAAVIKPCGAVPKALIGPHAGTVYSGPVAATGYAHLAPLREVVRRVVLLGPSHRVSFRGLAAPTAEAFETPLGDVAVDQAALRALVDNCSCVQVLDAAHSREHSLELQLPFLLSSFNCLSVVPLVVGEASAEDVCEVLQELWGGSETLFVVSTDLSHFHGYAEAKRIDRETSDRIENLDLERLAGDRACGYRPLQGILLAARRRGMSVQTVDLRSSGDTAGNRREVVGYGSFLVS